MGQHTSTRTERAAAQGTPALVGVGVGRTGVVRGRNTIIGQAGAPPLRRTALRASESELAASVRGKSEPSSTIPTRRVPIRAVCLVNGGQAPPFTLSPRYRRAANKVRCHCFPVGQHTSTRTERAAAQGTPALVGVGVGRTGVVRGRNTIIGQAGAPPLRRTALRASESELAASVRGKSEPSSTIPTRRVPIRAVCLVNGGQAPPFTLSPRYRRAANKVRCHCFPVGQHTSTRTERAAAQGTPALVGVGVGRTGVVRGRNTIIGQAGAPPLRRTALRASESELAASCLYESEP